MIKITYQLARENLDCFIFLEVKGHANYAPKGKDLVCAAVSAVINGSFNFLQENYAAFCAITYRPAEVKIFPLKEKRINFVRNKELQLCLKMLFYQLKNISLSYPNYFSFVKLEQ